MNIALIIGCARSGTSILGELIAAHPDVFYLFEAQRVWELGPQAADGSHRRTAADAIPEIADKIRTLVSVLTKKSGKPLVVEKCPRNTLRVSFIHKILPEAKIIHIVRDGRDVACSLRPGLTDCWNHLKPPGWKALMDEPLISRCAKTWRDVVSLALDELRNIPHLQVKYEDLLTSTSVVSKRLRDYLDLPDSNVMTAFEYNIQDSTSAPHHAMNQSAWFRPDHSKRIGRWRQNLSQEEQGMVNEILAPLLNELGYT